MNAIIIRYLSYSKVPQRKKKGGGDITPLLFSVGVKNKIVTFFKIQIKTNKSININSVIQSSGEYPQEY